MLLIKLLISKKLYYILCITQFLMNHVLNLDIKEGTFLINNYPCFFKQKNAYKSSKNTNDDNKNIGKAAVFVDFSGFVDIFIIVVYNLLVYVLMEFRGHTIIIYINMNR